MTSHDSGEPNSTYADLSAQTLTGMSSSQSQYEVLSLEAAINAGNTLKNKRKKCDSPEVGQLGFPGPPESMETKAVKSAHSTHALFESECPSSSKPIVRDDSFGSPETTALLEECFGGELRARGGRKNHRSLVSTPIASAIAADSPALSTANSQGPNVYESRTKEPKICWKCFPPKTVKDTPALKRHCSEVHRQDTDGNPISVDLFPCFITTCPKHTKPFKRREKLAHHIQTFHAAIIESKEVNHEILAGQRDAALTTNNTAEAGDYFGGNYGVAQMSAAVYNKSAEVNVWSPAVFEERFSPPIEVQSGPVANGFDVSLSSTPKVPVDATFRPSSTSEKDVGDATNSLSNSTSMYNFWGSALGAHTNRIIGPAAGITKSNQMSNAGFLNLNEFIDPTMTQSFPSGGFYSNLSSPSALPELSSDCFPQIAIEGVPAALAKTISVQYNSIDEAKQALLDARKMTFQKLQFINQQIENLEGRKQNRNHAVGALQSVNGSFL